MSGCPITEIAMLSDAELDEIERSVADPKVIWGGFSPRTIRTLVAMARRTREAEAERDAAVNALMFGNTEAEAKAESTIAQLRKREATLREAVDLACGYLIGFEPEDSRAVSNEFVALAAIAAGTDNDACWDVVRRARADLDSLAATSPEPSEGKSAPDQGRRG